MMKKSWSIFPYLKKRIVTVLQERVYKKYTFQKMVKKPREREQKKQIYTNAKKAGNGCLKGSKKI